jgi:hypothetical protein
MCRPGREELVREPIDARRFGVRSAMPSVTAERLCPDTIFIPPDFVRHKKEASRAIQGIFERHTNLIEPLSLDEAYLDVTANKTGLPTATLVARKIRQQIREELDLIASAGVAPNKFLAKIASDWRKPNGSLSSSQTKYKPSFCRYPWVAFLESDRSPSFALKQWGSRPLAISSILSWRSWRLTSGVTDYDFISSHVGSTIIRLCQIERASQFLLKTPSSTMFR